MRTLMRMMGASCILTSNLSNFSASVGTCFSLSKSANKGGIMFICLVNLASTVFRFPFDLWISTCLPFFRYFAHLREFLQHSSTLVSGDIAPGDQRRDDLFSRSISRQMASFSSSKGFSFGNLAPCLLCVLPCAIHSMSNCISRKIHSFFL